MNQLKMSLLLLLSVYYVSDHVIAGTLRYDQSFEFLQQSIRDKSAVPEVRKPAPDEAVNYGEMNNTKSTNSDAPCCFPFVWQCKLITWDGIRRFTYQLFYDYPGRRVASYTVPKVSGSITKQTKDGRFVDSYAFDQTQCKHYRSNDTMLPWCLPRTSELFDKFNLGPPVYDQHSFNVQVWSVDVQQLVTVRSSDCAPVESSSGKGGTLFTVFCTDVETHIDDLSVFDPPPICRNSTATDFGAEKLEEVQLFGRPFPI